MNATETQSGSSLNPLVGRKWKAVINGKRGLNGARYSATYTGDIEAAGDDQTIYDVLRELADHLEQVNAEMERPDSYQVTLFPPNAEIRRPGPDAPESNPRRQPGSPASNG